MSLIPSRRQLKYIVPGGIVVGTALGIALSYLLHPVVYDSEIDWIVYQSQGLKERCIQSRDIEVCRDALAFRNGATQYIRLHLDDVQMRNGRTGHRRVIVNFIDDATSYDEVVKIIYGRLPGRSI